MAVRQHIWSYLLPPALVLVGVLLLRLSVLSVVRVHSNALSPQITPGAVAFVFSRAELAQGRGVLFRLGIEAQQGEELALGRISRTSIDSLGQDLYWILSDDTLQHPDSRELGWIARRDVVGVVVCHFNF